MSTQEERLKALEDKMSTVQTSVSQFADSQKVLLDTVSKNVDLTERIARDTAEIIGAWKDTKSAFRLFNILVDFFWGIMKYIVLPILVLIALVYVSAHGEAPAWLRNSIKLLTG